MSGFEQPSVAANRRPSRAQRSLVLLVVLLACLSFWCAVALGIAAAI